MDSFFGIRAVSPTASAPDHSGRLHGGERAQRRKGQTEHIRPYRSKEFPCCLSGSRLTVLSFLNHCHFLSGLCRDCTDHIPCLRNLPPVFRHFPRTAIRKPDSLTAPSVYRKPDGKRLANPHGTLPSKEPSFPPAMTDQPFFSLFRKPEFPAFRLAFSFQHRASNLSFIQSTERRFFP
ncbi:hypothetical protein K0H24_03915 [Bacteroides fragilis]|nr:hypothetical protein [Bacteroides fragilis]